MRVLSRRLNFSSEAAPLPPGFSEKVFECSRTISNADSARHLYDELRPVMERYRADRHMAIACGLLLEKQRVETGMRELWDDLQHLYPDDTMALRMLMRWYRRDRRTEAGIAHLEDLYPRAWHDLEQASLAVLGLSELKAWDRIDRILDSILLLHPDDRGIRMSYIKALNEQSRYPDAARVAAEVAHRERMGDASQELLASVERNAATMARHGREDAASAILDLIARADPPRALTGLRRAVFFTGQLGTGGAERQMTRIACGFQKRLATAAGGLAPEVWVKHANAATGADFYLPMLQGGGVPTRILTEEREVAASSLGLSREVEDLVELLAPDMRRHTCQLTEMFRRDAIDVAYLWQDGGIVQSALAAVLAGVPRIVTSFRGMPPNIRPNFYRDEMPVLYSALARLPQVTFTANSRKAADAYEDWLGLEPRSIVVIPNATPAVMSDGDASDHDYWYDVLTASETCTNTVLGVFRLDANKRPLQWIETAARYLKTRDDTRFVILGNGALFADCQKLIEEKGLANRVFLAGIRSNVGFYLHRADLLMHLARMEGLPNVVIEAQIAGTPVLATPAGGTDEVIDKNVTGIILSDAATVPEEELAGQLSALLSDKDRLARLGAAARLHSLEKFSVDTILDRTLELFADTGTGIAAQ